MRSELPANMIRDDELHLVLFFTRGMSLAAWDRVGLFDREVALYRRLVDGGVRVTFITYGDEDDLRYADKLPGIEICCNDTGLSAPVYAEQLPALHGQSLAAADLFKTNQTTGGDVALRAAKMWHKPLIARCGYLASDCAARREGVESQAHQEALRVEHALFSRADRIVVTTDLTRVRVAERLPARAGAISVIPNYVDTELFRPAQDVPIDPRRLCYVGRLDQPEKNLCMLVEAVRGLDVTLDLIGDGPLRSKLEAVSETDERLRVLGTVPNARLPAYLQRSAAFVFPTFGEGHPKSLLEAMASGCPVVATDVEGVREVITHGETGWLCDTTAASFRAGIETVLADTALANRLGQGARRFVTERFALDSVWQKELDLYRQIVGASEGVGHEVHV